MSGTDPVVIAHFPTIKREEAQRFLNALDDRTDRFTFQTFDDNKDRRASGLARVLHGTLGENYQQLLCLSQDGAGIFVTINATNFKGRKSEDITEVRAYYADLDGAPFGNIKRLSLSPHIITETSPGRYGAYWLITDAPLDAKKFKATQQQLAQLLESDPNVCDLPRCTRLPGFPHQKELRSSPFITQIISLSAADAYSDQRFQQALIEASILANPISRSEIRNPAAYAQRHVSAYKQAEGAPKRLLDGAYAGNPPVDLSKGYEEGKRNIECARVAGSILGKGGSEEEALAKCLEWNNGNKPPLDEKEVRECVHSIAKIEAKKREGIILDSDVQQLPQNYKFIFDGEANTDPPKMLIKKLLPASGIAFIGGQSGAGKTFVAIALAVALAGGTEFFKYNVKEPIGVAFVAAEGIGMFAQRVAAAKLAAEMKGPIPFAWSGSVPNLQTQEGTTAFIAELRSLKQEMQKRFDVRLGAIFMDTVAACFVMQDENSNAEVSSIMRHISDSVGTVIIPIHHYGKDAGTGLRGASAWRGAADVTISVTANIDQLTGKVSNRELALAKARDAEQGPIAPFILEWVKLGVDDDGEDFGSCIIKLDLQPRPPPTQGKGSKGSSRGMRAFDNACRIALSTHGEFRYRGKDGAEFRIVELKHVKAQFGALYVTGEDDTKKAETINRAWRRALEKMPGGYFTEQSPDGREWLWPKN
jgi:hypothetical protein